MCDRSVAYILQGRYDAALQQLEGARSSSTSPASVENVRGLALMLRGDLTPALASFDRALKLDPSLAEARLNRGIALLRSGSYAAASAELARVKSPTLAADAAYHNAIALDRLGRTADAAAALDRALKLDPKLDAALLYAGMLRERQGDLQGAGRAYLDYLKAHPDSPVALLRFGVSAQKAGRVDVAKSYLQRVIAVAPRSAEAVEAQKHLVMWE
ncbi:MAG TPA: tetratricopeptide repeat protein [Thermoanaerobaculia bacterium]|nr:tetratricopeptide repeat protein [Thermoanaerobaculia bacterium]